MIAIAQGLMAELAAEGIVSVAGNFPDPDVCSMRVALSGNSEEPSIGGRPNLALHGAEVLTL